MSDLDILREMIADSAIIPPTVQYGKGVVVLDEPGAPDSSVKISDLPHECIVIKADQFKSPDTIFTEQRGARKRADYIVIAEVNSETVVIYIELKRNKGRAFEVSQQLAGAKCFISYCTEVGRLFWQELDFLKRAKHRFVSVAHTSPSKQPTRIERSAVLHDSPERPLKVSWARNLWFNHLASVNG